jgi:hypothetical protein
MTADEIADYETRQAAAQADAAAHAAAVEAQTAARASALTKLAALGLTEEEIKAIVGGV